MNILMISGSVRAGSVNGAVIATAVDLLPRTVGAVVYDGLARLPHFNPDHDHDPLHPAVAELRRLIDESSGLFLSTPEYAGAMPGALKNLLEWTVGGVETTRKPAGWANPSTMPNRAAGTYASLRTVLDYTDVRVVDDACIDVPVPRDLIGTDGRIGDDAVRASLSLALAALVRAGQEC